MRRTSTCAWRRCPRACSPCVASRRRSWATTRWTAARSASGPDGSARSSSPSGRAGGRLPVRSICARSSSRRSSASKRRSASRGSPSRRGSSGGSSGWGSARRPSARRMRCTSTPITPEPSWRRANAAIAMRARSRIAPSAPSRSAAAICARSASSSSSESSPSSAQVVLAHALARGRELDRAEEEAVEHELEHAPVLLALGERRGERLAEVLLRGPADLAEHLEGVEQLRGPDRDAFAAQLLAQLEDARRQALQVGAGPSGDIGGRSRASARRARPPRPCRCGA